MTKAYIWNSTDPPIEQIYDLLYRLGMVANTVTFFYTSYAILLSIQEPQRLELITKLLYPDVAKHYNSTKTAVEKGIRKMVDRIWRDNPQLLSEMTGKPLKAKPSNTQFLIIASSYLTSKT